MSDPQPQRLSAAGRRRPNERSPADKAPVASDFEAAPANSPAPSSAATPGLGALIPFDPLRLLLAVRGRWPWAVAGALFFTAPALFLGWLKLETTYTSSVQVIRRELPNSFRASDVGEAFKPRQFSVGTVVSMMRSPSLLAKVGAQARPRQSARALLGNLTITPEKNTDLITVGMTGRHGSAPLAELINLFAQEVVELTRTLQQQEAAELDRHLREQLARTETELTDVNTELLAFSKEASFYDENKELEAYLRELGDAEASLQNARIQQETFVFRIASIERELSRQNPQMLRLSDAQIQLKALLTRYTDANPLVAEQRSRVAELEAEVRAAADHPATNDFQPGSSSVANSMYLDLINLRAQREALTAQLKQMEDRRVIIESKLKSVPEKAMRFSRLKTRQLALDTTRILLAGRQREARLFAENSPGYYRLFAPASANDVVVSDKKRKLTFLAVAAAFAGAGLALLAICAREALDDRVVSPGDLRRATGLRVLARLDDLKDASPTDLANWRYRTWAILNRELADPETGSICAGLLSARPAEGRSTWLKILAEAARERGHHSVLVTPLAIAEADVQVSLADFLRQPGQLAHHLDSNTPRSIAICIPADWAWDVPHRAMWAHALRNWEMLPGVALLLELPPASQLESILLAETLPSILWLSESGKNRQSDLAALIATARDGQVRFSGAFLNRPPAIFNRLPDLARFGFLFLGLALAGNPLPGFAQLPAPTPPLPAVAPAPIPATMAPTPANPTPPGEPTTTLVASLPVAPGTFSASAAAPKLAPWQERLELGPGDIVDLSVYGRKELTRTGVPVGPDGRISFLQAQGIVATGLTIDELRDKLTRELQVWYKNVRVLANPVAWRSKKYYLLGTIMDRGAFYLDRPITIIEATARARGIATGLLEQNTVEIADLPHAFLIRRGQRVPVDFQKLFEQGDLSQNIALEPGDYIYFPSTVSNEAYILGDIASPGTVGVSASTTLIRVLTIRGGFTRKAWRKHVLVIRGSLNQPETFVINAAAILAGKEKDFLLQPKDIIYIADRPWTFAEDILDTAIRAFTQTAVSTWASKNVPAAITDPIIPSL